MRLDFAARASNNRTGIVMARPNPLKRWTIPTATAFGIIAGLAALLMWGFRAAAYEIGLALLIAALVCTLFAGASVLWMTLRDVYGPRQRSRRIRAIRSLDVVVSAVLIIPSALLLRQIL
jgi:uncharacterized membrane-anchored protein